MKKLLLLFALLIGLSGTSFSQRMYSSMSYGALYHEAGKPHPQIAEAGYTGENWQRKDIKKGLFYSHQQKQYNPEGFLISEISYRNKGKKIRSSRYYVYTNGKLSAHCTLNEDGDSLSWATYTYKNGKQTGYKQFSKKNPSTPYYSYETILDEKDRILETRYLRKGKQFSRYVNSYSEDGKRVESKYYNNKNKLVAITSYACDAKGETVEKEVKQRNFCTRKESLPNGNYVEINEYTNHKGKVFRSVTTYNKDSLLIERVSYTPKGKESYKQVNTYSTGKLLSRTESFDQGKPSWAYELDYTDKGFAKASRTFNSKGKLVDEFKIDWSK